MLSNLLKECIIKKATEVHSVNAQKITITYNVISNQLEPVNIFKAYYNCKVYTNIYKCVTVNDIVLSDIILKEHINSQHLDKTDRLYYKFIVDKDLWAC
jgi:hypothetical protein